MLKLKHLGLLAGMGAIALIFAYLVVSGEDQFLDSMVSTGPNITLDAWRELFRLWATLGIFGAWLAAWIWFALGQWIFRLNHWTNAKKRTVWVLLFLLSLLTIIPGVLLTPAVQEWGRLAFAFYLFNNFCVYYLATLLCSPPSFKYTPVGAMTVRYW